MLPSPTPHARSRSRLARLAASAAIAAAPLAHAGITGRWTSATDWEYRTTDMPDLDQGRAGLPGNGFMYCGPTASTNVLLYAMHHGYPGLLDGIWPDPAWSAPAGFAPAPANWLSWQAGAAGDDAFFGHSTTNLQTMGSYMATGAQSGTSFEGLYWGLRRALGPQFNVHAHIMSPWYTITLNRIGQSSMERGAVLVVVGYYQISGYAFGYPIVTRTGGHVMTLSRARRLGNDCVAFCRDPADDLLPLLPGGPPAGVLAAQSDFRDRAFTATDGWVLYAQAGFPLHYRYVTAFRAPDDGGQLMLVDAFYTVRPKAGFAKKEFTGGAAAVPALARVEASTWSDATEIDEWILSPSGTEILDYAPFGAGSSIVMLTAPAMPGGPAQLGLVNPDTDESAIVAEIDGATALVAGMPSDIWVHTGDEIHLVWLDPTEAEYPDGDAPGALLDSIVLPGVAELVRFDDDARRLVAIDLDDRVAYVVTPAATPIIETRDLPLDFPAGESITGDIEVIEGGAGSFIASVDGSTTLVEIDLASPITVTRTIPVAGMAAVSDVSIADGRLFVAGDGAVKEFARDAGGDWIEVESGAFAETEVDAAFRVVRSQTNVDAAIHEGEGYQNIDPSELVTGEPVPTCADLDGDGLVSFLDLLYLLSFWGPVPSDDLFEPADFNLDFQVGFLDLLILLSQWGPCSAP
jgi:hypothetical protein